MSVLQSFWNIQLLGRFALFNEKGVEARMPSRKAQALIAILALNEGRPMAREQLGKDLWPNKPKVNQQQNLRKALQEIKKATAPNILVDAGREACLLSNGAWSCDALECIRDESEPIAQLLPEFTESVFDQWKDEIEWLIPQFEGERPAKGALELVNWLLCNSSDKVLEVLFEAKDLVPLMAHRELEDALKRSLAKASEDHPHFIWANCQVASLLRWQGKPNEGLVYAKQALRQAQIRQMKSDWASSVALTTLTLLFSGRISKAQTLLERALSIAEKEFSTIQVDELRHAMAHVKAYQGYLSEAIDLLSSLRDECVSAPARTLRCSHRAIYLSFNGQLDLAYEQLGYALRDSVRISDPRVLSQVKGAEATYHYYNGELELASETIRGTLPLEQRFDLTMVMVHRLEMLALCEADPNTARGLLKDALELRKSQNASLLPLDRIKLARLIS